MGLYLKPEIAGRPLLLALGPLRDLNQPDQQLMEHL
jgi:hypothetical protein